MSLRRLHSDAQWIKLAWAALPPRPPVLFLRPARRQYSSTLAAPSRSESRATSLQSEVLADMELDVFERYAEEYDAVPPSTLDHPPAPRSAADSLRSLLLAGQYPEADALLRDLNNTDQHIEHAAAFAEHAEVCLARDRTGSWLQWWALAPTIAQAPAHSTQQAPQVISTMAFARVHRMLAILLEEPGEFEALLDFGLLAVSQGAARVVAQDLLAHLAAFGPLEMAEELWEACRLVSPDQVPIVPQRVLATSHQNAESQSSALGRALRRTKVTGALKDKIRCEAQQADLKRFLRAKRSQMLRIYSSTGRLDDATELLEAELRRHVQSSDSGTRSTPGPIRHITYLYLLADAAHFNRLDLFQRLYASMPLNGSRTTRIHTPTYTTKFPFFMRALIPTASATIIPEESLSAEDAFVVFRYSGYESAIEEGGAFTDHKSDAQVRAALVATDVKTVFRLLRQCIENGLTPALSTTTDAILLARARGYTALVDALLEQMSSRDGVAGTRSWTRGYWATAGMLSHVRMGEWQSALRIFVNAFQMQGLPELYRRVAGATLHRSPEASFSKEYRTIVPSAHTFSIAVQALVPYAVEIEGGGEVVDQLYDALVHEQVIVTPRRTAPVDAPASPLDPYTFMPFLRAFAADDRDPIHLLHVLRDMRDLGLRETHHHWGVVLGAFARKGTPQDLTHLLDRLEQVTPAETTAPTAPVDSIASELFYDDNVQRTPRPRPDVVAYTSIIAGLASRQEYVAARFIQARMATKLRRGQSDQRLDEVLNLVSRYENSLS